MLPRLRDAERLFFRLFFLVPVPEDELLLEASSLLRVSGALSVLFL